MVSFSQRADGITVANISNSAAKAEISLYGAHVLSYIPKGQKDVLFLGKKSFFAPGKPIRGGIPVCFPWFGPHAKDATLPPHGFARLSQWTLAAVEETDKVTTITLELTDTEATRKMWNASFRLACKVSVGATLEIALTATNTGAKSFVIADALHTYFNIKNVDKVTVAGLDKASYIDRVGEKTTRKQSGDVAISGETDRVYLKPKAVTVSDPGFRRTILVDKKNFPDTVIWNCYAEKAKTIPDLDAGEYKNYICVEAAAVFDDSITVEAGKSVSQKLTITSTVI